MSAGQKLRTQEDDQIAEEGWQCWKAELGNRGGGSRAYTTNQCLGKKMETDDVFLKTQNLKWSWKWELQNMFTPLILT